MLLGLGRTEFAGSLIPLARFGDIALHARGPERVSSRIVGGGIMRGAFLACAIGESESVADVEVKSVKGPRIGERPS